MAKKTYDFDSWTPDAQRAALEELAAKQRRFRHLIDGEDFVVEFPDKTTLALPLKITTSDLLEVEQMRDSGAAMVKRLLDLMGNQDAVEKFGQYPVTLTTAIAETYFDALAELMQISAGK